VSPAGRIAALHRLAGLALASGDAEVRAIGADLAAWLAAPPNSAGTLEAALGISAGQSERSWRTIARLEARDAALRMAAQDFDLGAAALATEMRRYRATGWKSDSMAPTCPARLVGTVREHLWTALKAKDRGLCERAMRDVIGEIGSELQGQSSERMGHDDSRKENAA